MASRRQRKSSNTFSTSTPYDRRQISTASGGCASDSFESSPGFESPNPRSGPLRGPIPKTYFSRIGSVTRSLSDVSTPTLPPHKQKRVSLLPPGSHVASGLLSHPSLDEEVDGLDAEDDILRREDADSLNEIIMAVDMKERGTLGCAYYIAREEKLCLMEDMKLANLDNVDLLKLHAQPTILLISSRAEEDLEDHLMREARSIDRGDDDSKVSQYTRRCGS